MEIVAECLKGGGCLAAPMRNGLVSDLMSSPAITAAEDAPVAEIADLFLSRRINRVPITDPAGKMVGIVSRSDILRASPLSIKP
jgi:CBS domain-containing protein